MVKTSARQLILTAVNNYTGGTLVSRGIMQLENGAERRFRNSFISNHVHIMSTDGGRFGSHQNSRVCDRHRICGGTTISEGTLEIGGGTFQADNDLTLTGHFHDTWASINTWHTTGSGELVFDNTATGDLGLSGNIAAGKVSLKGSFDGNF